MYCCTDEGIVQLGAATAVTKQELAEIDLLFPPAGRQIKGILIGEGDESIRIFSGNTIQLPRLSGLTDEQKELLKFLESKSHRTDWLYNLSIAEKIEYADLPNLKAIQDDNRELIASYYRIKRTSLPGNGLAIADMQSFSGKPQIIVKTGDALPVVKTIDDAVTHEQLEKMSQQLLEDGYAYSLDEIKKITQPYASMLKKVAEATSANRIVTLEPKGINSQLLNELYGIAPDKVFYKDQPDLETSLANASKDIYPDISHTVLLASVDIESPEYPDIKNIGDSLKSYGLKFILNAKVAQLGAILKDTMIRQVILLVRSDQYGSFFKNAYLENFNIEFDDIPGGGSASADDEDFDDFEVESKPKDFIYILSNNTSGLEDALVKRKLFSRIITSNFTSSRPDLFQRSFSILKNIYSKVFRTQKNVGEGSKYRPRNIDELIRETQKEELFKLQSTPVEPIKILRSIPVFKCSIDPIPSITC